MKTITADFKNEIPKIGKQNDIIVSYDSTTVKPERIRVSFDGEVFKTSMTQVEIEIANGDNLVGKDVDVKFGLLVGEDYEYIEWNDLYVYKTDINNDKKITTSYAYDRMIEFMVKYDIESEATTLLGYIQDICTRIGIELYSEVFFNSDLAISQDYFTGLNITYRDILDKIAEITFTNILIKDGKLWLRDVRDMYALPEVLTNDIIQEGAMTEYFGNINSFVAGRSPQIGDDVYEKDEEDIAINGLHELRFNNNEFIDSIRETVVLPMFNEIKGFGYYPTNTKTLGLGYVEFGDCLSIPNLAGTEFYKTIITSYDFSVTTGTKDTIISSIPKTSTTRYEYAKTTEKRLNNTEIIVNNQTNQISAIAEGIDSNTSNIAEIKLNVNSITDRVETSETDITTLSENLNTQVSTLTQTATALDLSIQNIIENGVDKVATSTGFTFNADGLTIKKSEEDFECKITNNGMYVASGTGVDTFTIFQGIARARKITIMEYLDIGENSSRIQDYGTDRTGVFFTGGEG